MFARFIGAMLLSASFVWCQGLTYSTYLRDGFTPSAIATDPAGNIYLAGSTIIDELNMHTAAMVLKLDPTGTQLRYVRTFGGSGFDAASAIAVDSAGNAYVTGTTASPDFPITAGRQPGTLPETAQSRALLVKFDLQGDTVFAHVLGSVSTTGLAVALAADGGILVSGVSPSGGMAVSAGAYSGPNGANRPYLMKLDASGANVVFTATGIGGDALAVDPTGNIYMAGTAVYLDYPTTPGAYQSFPNPPAPCAAPCIFATGGNQYVTKVNPAASKLIYSTGVAGDSRTVNRGLAIDAAGNAYVTGAANGYYHWTGTQPNNQLVEPFLTKLDAAGANALYSIAIGGAGVVLGSQGDVYVGGAYHDINLGFIPPVIVPALPLGISSLPAQCQTNDLTTFSEAYVSHIDAATGNVLGTVLVDGSNVSASGIALAGASSVWLAGPTSQADTPITPGALAPSGLRAGVLPGAYLGEAKFDLTQTVPQVACVTDAANQARTNVVAPGQLLTLFGNGLGPAMGVAATDYSTTSLAGVTVTFDGAPAALLYVSSSQINVAVPAAEPVLNSQGEQNFAVMQVSVNRVAGPLRALPVVKNNPSLFGDLSGAVTSCTVGEIKYFSAFTDVAVNADGTPNDCAHPAASGTVVSLFLNGLGPGPGNGTSEPWTPSQIPVAVTIDHWSAEVVSVLALNPFVWQVDVVVPSAAAQNGMSLEPVTVEMNFTQGATPVGPLSVGDYYPFYAAPGTAIPLSIWVGP